MMRKAILAVALLALCTCTVAMDRPNMIGKWTEISEGVGYLKNTNWQATGNVSYWDENNTYIFTEQNGTRFVGKVIPTENPNAAENVLGIFSHDNTSITMVDEGGMFWGEVLSPTQIAIYYQKVGMDGIELSGGLLTKI